jgi:hypothetical protein
MNGGDEESARRPINSSWMMAPNRELEDRKYGVVNVRADFASIPSGLDKGR